MSARRIANDERPRSVRVTMLRYILWIFGLAYLAALVLFVIGTFGLFGSERGPLAGVFLLPLGVPWIWLVDLAPERFWPWLLAAAPVVNLAILWAMCQKFGK
ncbi:MAG TPA: hypothetical protein VLK65_28645 [Vicinamibacteria bacterium]|nr:hypothetical protein [Vicinamibacteria bacterium]